MVTKYLTTFNTEAQYNEFLNSLECPYVNVSHISQTGENKYYKETSAMQLQPFTLYVNECPGEINFRIVRGDSEYVNSSETIWTYYRYKKNNDPWKSVTIKLNDWSAYSASEINLQQGDTVQIIIKSNMGGVWPFVDNDLTGCKFTISGNVMSLVWGDDYVYAPTDKLPFPNYNSGPWGGNHYEGTQYVCFNFSNSNIVDASDLWLPSKNLVPNIFKDMFKDNNLLTAAPDIKSKYLPDSACYGMFSGCTSLTSMPLVLAETVERNAMRDMFRWCTSITTTTPLHIKHFVPTNGNGPLDAMFCGCIALTDAPQWDAHFDLVLPDKYYYGEPEHLYDGNGFAWCFAGMFMGCAALETCNWHMVLDFPFNGDDPSPWLDMFAGINSDEYGQWFFCNSLTTIPIIELKNNTNYSGNFKYPDICGSGENAKTQNLITEATVLGVTNSIYNDYGGVPAGFDTTSGTFYLSADSEYLPGGSLENDYPISLSSWTKAVYTPSN